MIDLTGKGGDILVASIDGVGTKVKVARAYGRYTGLGRDIVAHCVNDILCAGARPVAFLDYIAFASLDRKVFTQVLRGLAGECRRHDVELLGGETAEMPGVYLKGEFDIAGVIVGLTSRRRLLDGSRIKKGDYLVGLPSNGLHTNGYSLARRVLPAKPGRASSLGRGWTWERLGTALLRPHTSYFAAAYPLVEHGALSGIAHITGGGIAGNLARILPRGTAAVVKKSTWRVPEIFKVIAECGPVPEDEMFKVFNMGLGMLLVVPHRNLPEVLGAAEGSRVVGEITEGDGGVIVS
jgi:phosphoribosylformylglycinamidine cyclo-ligase